jgi:hypothetical protein
VKSIQALHRRDGGNGLRLMRLQASNHRRYPAMLSPAKSPSRTTSACHPRVIVGECRRLHLFISIGRLAGHLDVADRLFSVALEDRSLRYPPMNAISLPAYMLSVRMCELSAARTCRSQDAENVTMISRRILSW